MTTTIYSSNNPPIKGLAWSTDFALYSQSDTKLIVTGVAFVAGDILVYKDGVLDGNIDTLPTQIGGSGIWVVTWSATEMNANRVTTVFHDVTGSAWCDAAIIINTVSTGTVSSVDYVDILSVVVPDGYAGSTVGYNIGRLGSGQIITTSVVAQSGDVETYQGDAYLNTDSRRIDWTDVSAAWPVLTGASILVVIGGDVSFAGTVVTATGASKKVGVELTAAQTLTIPATEDSGMEFVVRATLSNGSVVTLVAGKWNSKRQLVVGS